MARRDSVPALDSVAYLDEAISTRLSPRALALQISTRRCGYQLIGIATARGGEHYNAWLNNRGSLQIQPAVMDPNPLGQPNCQELHHHNAWQLSIPNGSFFIATRPAGSKPECPIAKPSPISSQMSRVQDSKSLKRQGIFSHPDP